MVQPFDVAWQRTDGLDLRDDALLRDSKQDAGRGESGLTVQPGVHVAQRAPSPCALLARPPDLLVRRGSGIGDRGIVGVEG